MLTQTMLEVSVVVHCAPTANDLISHANTTKTSLSNEYGIEKTKNENDDLDEAECGIAIVPLFRNKKHKTTKRVQRFVKENPKPKVKWTQAEKSILGSKLVFQNQYS
ncbi:hypothetical protein FQA39_LY09335 [Lamprigera yunnana]|nr:hypothetical protein FQA39_LY09335 [Lamprigera yunnana]